ncbi:hypothetical protein SPRG_07263 [Saprolegnia parasitica CBS 223.65]|uniref:FYVE-type domain-containing protein n=1 Tax=Saprolegnia parasitica (strain CBS 223.65) TaxID=695850 RepID=A0A067CFM8_SAPPC|nr:hypothetical protein SPRG_07263 [Saprolegnia parasitica CBS 223.65]KDO27985.1 hypothetical protein SPRG_07263 [Saprolegnia parasitica CBS 223.65]|eukprot:XP_012201434.1 hypothetical protein SPRG_07263 [Saprolegnia parasitica CBS 223.65]
MVGSDFMMAGGLPLGSPFPLRSSYFESSSSKGRLSATQTAMYEAEATRHLDIALANLYVERESTESRHRSQSHPHLPRPFRHEVDAQGYSVYERDDSVVRMKKKTTKGGSSEIKFTCRTDIEGGPLEMMELMYADDTDSLRRWGQIYFPSMFVDGVMLHVLKHSDDDDPLRFCRFSSLCWMAWNTPVRSASRRDTCVLKTTGATMDSDGNQLFYILCNSVDVPNCPLLEKPFDLVRAHIQVAVFFQTSPTNGTRMTTIGVIDPQGSLSFPSRAVEAFSTNLLNSMHQLSIHLESYRISRRPLCDRVQWVPDSERKECYACHHSFGLFRARHHCRACGEVMCKKCMVLRPIYGTELLEITHHHAVIEKFCKPCVLYARSSTASSSQCSSSSKRAPNGTNLSDCSTYRDSNNRLSFFSLETEPTSGESRSSTNRRKNLTSPSEDEEFPAASSPQPFTDANGHKTAYDHGAKMDSNTMAHELWKMSVKARRVAHETATLTKATMSAANSRNGTPVGTPRAEIRDSFRKMDQTLAEQAFLLDAIDRAARSRYSLSSPRHADDAPLRESPFVEEVV